MTNDKFTKAEADRTSQALLIAQLEKKARAASISVSSAQLQLENSRKIQKDLLEIHARIITLGPADIKPHEDEFVSLCERLDNVMCKFTEVLLLAVPPTASGTTPAPPLTPTTRHHQMKLPEMQLPLFEGRFEDWPSFEDLFKATIDKNTSLSAAQKLQYLKSCVTGEAQNLIRSFIITDSNYVEAWTLLSSRYNNQREILYSITKKMLFQQQIQSSSVAALQSLLNTTVECVRSLKVMGRPTDKWDDILVVSTVEKMDPDTKSEWAKSLTGTNPTTFNDLTEFLEKHIRSLIAREAVITKISNSNQQTYNKGQSNRNSKQQVSSHHLATASCLICKESHFLYQCRQFREMNPSSRFAAVRRSSYCINCLRDGHTAKDCSSKHTFKTCSQKHNTLLHINRDKEASNGQSASQPNSAQSTSTRQGTARVHTSSSVNTNQSTHVLLKTAVVKVKDTFGILRPFRVLLDDGSEASFITEACATLLGLKRTKTDVKITGISATHAAQAQWKVTARLESRVHPAFVDVEALVLSKVTGTLPRITCSTDMWTHLTELELADPTYNQPGDIDMLLGADVVASIMRDGRRQGPANSPIAMNSILGWVLSGRIQVTESAIVEVQRFWEVEEVPNRKPYTIDETACENFFKQTVTRTDEGRYIVRLPVKPQYTTSVISSVGDTRLLAERRLFQLEKRFSKYPQHHNSYKQFMQEYLELGHMEPAQISAHSSHSAVYIPHHFVIKEDSSTTKLRVVFDASMKGAKNLSLNDTLLVGPTIQDDLFTLLLRFRLHPIALKADVAKMYRQFEVHPDDRDYQRILWRDNSDQPIQEFRLKTVTYGTASAPYLATRCLQQLAEDEMQRYPGAAAIMKSDMYVDDLISGESSTQSAIDLTRELIAIMTTGGMSIRKWCSSDPEVMASIPEDLRETGSEFTFDEDASIKALGIIWQPTSDSFAFKVNSSPVAMTKRDLLSEIAKTFDPMGWLSPFTIRAKILFQSLWNESIGWDDVMDKTNQQGWRNHQEELQSLSQLHIQRCVAPAGSTEFQLHAFSDASEKAYAAAVSYPTLPYPSSSLGLKSSPSYISLSVLQWYCADLQNTSAANLNIQALPSVQWKESKHYMQSSKDYS